MKIKNKAWLVVVFLTLFVLGETYSQENNALSFNFEALLKTGIGYERRINEYFSCTFSGSFVIMLGAVADAPYGGSTTIELDFLTHFRYYPLKSSMKKLFWDIGTGYKFISIKTDESETMNLFPIQTRIGWKFDIKNFFIQPWIGYNKDFGKEHYINDELFKHGYPILGIGFGLLF